MKIDQNFPRPEFWKEEELFELDIEIREEAKCDRELTGVITVRNCYTRICTKQGCTC